MRTLAVALVAAVLVLSASATGCRSTSGCSTCGSK